MNSHRLYSALRCFPSLLEAALIDVEDEEARERPAEGRWTIVEVVRHILDEERRDFRPRLKHVLGHAEPWANIDPVAWASGDQYIGACLADTVAEFRLERAASLEWLDSLVEPAWERSRKHLSFDHLHAGDLLASWAAHDAAHLAQIARLRVDLIDRAAGQFGVRYALG